MTIQKFIFLMLAMTININLMAQDPWKITASNITPDKYYGITSANGAIGILSSPEPLHVKRIVLAGTYDNWGETDVAKFMPTLNILDLGLTIDGISVSASTIRNYRQVFDTHYGIFTSSFTVPGKAEVTYSWCALRQLPYNVYGVLSIHPLKDINIHTSYAISCPDPLKDCVQSVGKVEAHDELHVLQSTATSPRGKVMISAVSMLKLPEGDKPEFRYEAISSTEHRFTFDKRLTKGKPYEMELIGAVISTRQYSNPQAQALRLDINVALSRTGEVMARHKAAWEDLWKGDITVEGNPQDQQDIHAMLYHLYAFSRAGTDYSPSPMGLSGFGYNGHVFWDTELWMMPALMPFHPELVRSQIDYRFNRLEAAKMNALANGYEGAMYPWESADDGTEETPSWVLTGIFEHHITACVGVAAWNYYLATGDEQWLRTNGWPVLKATADFWVSRAVPDADGSYSINNVVCADEYAQNVDNNAFTNGAAKRNIEYALKCADKLGYQPNKAWRAVADGLKIEKMPDGTTAEYKGYNGETIKQADVNLLAFPLALITDKAQVKKDLDYYEAHVDYGVPAMTQAIFSILSSYLGDSRRAYQFFKDAYVPNQLPPFGVLAETQGGTNPYFATGAGGAIQSVVYGLAGIRLSPDGGYTLIDTELPKQWKKLIITGIGKGKKTITVTRK